MKKRIPSLRRHKPSSQGVVTLDGRDLYLGKWPEHLKEAPPAVRDGYDNLIAEWLANGRRSIPAYEEEQSSSINELILAFWRHAEQHYRDHNGNPTTEVRDYRFSLRPLREAYGSLPVHEFTPLKLKAVRQKMIDAGLSRGVINQRISRIVSGFQVGCGRRACSRNHLESPYRSEGAGKGTHGSQGDRADPSRL